MVGNGSSLFGLGRSWGFVVGLECQGRCRGIDVVVGVDVWGGCLGFVSRSIDWIDGGEGRYLGIAARGHLPRRKCLVLSSFRLGTLVFVICCLCICILRPYG